VRERSKHPSIVGGEARSYRFPLVSTTYGSCRHARSARFNLAAIRTSLRPNRPRSLLQQAGWLLPRHERSVSSPSASINPNVASNHQRPCGPSPADRSLGTKLQADASENPPSMAGCQTGTHLQFWGASIRRFLATNQPSPAWGCRLHWLASTDRATH
jgi:hypothetical protein